MGCKAGIVACVPELIHVFGIRLPLETLAAVFRRE
jgi:hypothetical protein